MCAQVHVLRHTHICTPSLCTPFLHALNTQFWLLHASCHSGILPKHCSCLSTFVRLDLHAPDPPTHPPQMEADALDGCVLQVDEGMASHPERAGVMGHLEIAEDAAAGGSQPPDCVVASWLEAHGQGKVESKIVCQAAAAGCLGSCAMQQGTAVAVVSTCNLCSQA